MKNLITLFIFSLLITKSYGQLKVIQNGNVGIGISYPIHTLHVWGFDQVFNYNNKEIAFRPYDQSGSKFHSTLGSNLGEIVFWHQAFGYNTITRGTCQSFSDERIKNSITSMHNSLNVIKQLSPKKFKYNDSIIPDGKYHYGFMAQDILLVIPELVDTSKRDLLTLNYEGIIPFLVGAIKEQSNTIDTLKYRVDSLITSLSDAANARSAKENIKSNTDSLNQQIKELKEQVKYIQNNCCKGPSNTNSVSPITSTTVPVTNNNGTINESVLLQNIPNPFDNTTTIKFNIPDQYDGKFFIKIYTLIGEERMSYTISKTDRQIMISSGNLPSGIYLYALIANNDVLGIKQMVISK